MNKALLHIQGILREKKMDVFLHVPPKTPYPYVSLELQSSIDNGNPLPGLLRAKGEIRVTVWSRYQGPLEVNNMMNTIENLLNAYRFQDGLRSFVVNKVKGDVKLLNDGLTRQGMLDFSIRLRG